MSRKPEIIMVPQPPMGCPSYLIERPGMFVLHVGPGTLITDACTHAGAGSMMIYDGVPDENGYFPEAPPVPEEGKAWQVRTADGFRLADLSEWREAYGRRHGRELLRKSPVVMGSWMLNAGFHNGLTVDVSGGHEGMAPVATIVWTPFRGAAR